MLLLHADTAAAAHACAQCLRPCAVPCRCPASPICKPLVLPCMCRPVVLHRASFIVHAPPYCCVAEQAPHGHTEQAAQCQGVERQLIVGSVRSGDCTGSRLAAMWPGGLLGLGCSPVDLHCSYLLHAHCHVAERAAGCLTGTQGRLFVGLWSHLLVVEVRLVAMLTSSSPSQCEDRSFNCQKTELSVVLCGLTLNSEGSGPCGLC